MKLFFILIDYKKLLIISDRINVQNMVYSTSITGGFVVYLPEIDFQF